MLTKRRTRREFVAARKDARLNRLKSQKDRKAGPETKAKLCERRPQAALARFINRSLRGRWIHALAVSHPAQLVRIVLAVIVRVRLEQCTLSAVRWRTFLTRARNSSLLRV